jgi:hypothetical protein
MINFVSISGVALLQVNRILFPAILKHHLLNFRSDFIDSRFSEPRINPCLQIEVASVILLESLLEAIDEVLEGGSFVGEVTEVNLDSLSHNVTTDKDVNLFQEASSLAIADLVIVVYCVVGVVDSNLNRVCGALSVVIKSFP